MEECIIHDYGEAVLGGLAGEGVEVMHVLGGSQVRLWRGVNGEEQGDDS